MTQLLHVFDGMNRGLRWLLFLPVGLIIAIVITGLVEQIFSMAAGGNYRTAAGLFELSALAFVACFTRTLFPAVISPRPWIVGIFIVVLDSMIRALPVVEVGRHEFSRSRVPQGATILAAGVVGGALALYLIARGTKR